jgi:hypothetical protein
MEYDISEFSPLPIPKCCLCGKELPPQPSIAAKFGQAGWGGFSNSKPGTGPDATCYGGWICEKCGSIYCHPCGGVIPGKPISLKCPKCSGKEFPLNSDNYRTMLVKAEDDLNKAASQGNIKRVKELIAIGVKINAKNKEGGIVLHNAASSGNLKLTKFLLEQGATVTARDRVNITPLYLAAREGHTEVVKLLLDNDAFIDVMDSVLGASPLIIAVAKGHADVVEVLAKRGADVNLTDIAGFSALQLAKKRGYTEIISILRSHGAKEK